MNLEKSRISKSYVQYIDLIHKLSDENAKDLMLRIANDCIDIIDTNSLADAHKKRFKDISFDLEGGGTREELIKPLERATNRVEQMIELAFLTNKCTKPNSIKADEKESFENKEKYDEIRRSLNSKDDKTRRKALKKLMASDYRSIEEFLENDRLECRKETFYEIKHKLLTSIIRELGENPSMYSDYTYGFIQDEDAYVFAINIPGHLGTYQFHIEPNHEKNILFDVNCFEIHHECEQLAEGNVNLGKVSFLCTKDEISDMDKVEEQLQKLKRELKSVRDISDPKDSSIDKFRKVFLYSILLGKNPRDELKDANEILANYFINENDCGLSEYTGEKTIEDKMNYKKIIDNLKSKRKLFIASPNTVDSRVAIESFKRKALELGFELKPEDIEEIKPGTPKIKPGIYLNLNKNGSDFHYHNQIAICTDEEKREASICSILSRLGFDIPRDVAFYANRVDSVIMNSRNAYLLAAEGMTGSQIFDLCEELAAEGKHLIDTELTDEQLDRYGVRETQTEIDDYIQECIYGTEIVDIGNKKVGIYKGNNPFAPFFAYSVDADYSICFSKYNEEDKNGIIFAVQSNPDKCDLPYEIMKWALNIKSRELERGAPPGSTKGFKYYDDMLIKSTRIICGGAQRPDIFLEDTRADKTEPFMEVTLNQMLNAIKMSEIRKLGLTYDRIAAENVNANSIIAALDYRLEEPSR